MPQYEVTKSPLTLPAGVKVQLTKEQASLREHCLKPLKGNVYEVTLPIQFKIGEVLGFESPDPALLKTFFAFEHIREIKTPAKTDPSNDNNPPKNSNNKGSAKSTEPDANQPSPAGQ